MMMISQIFVELLVSLANHLLNVEFSKTLKDSIKVRAANFSQKFGKADRRFF